MKVLVIGNDPKIFDKNSGSYARVCEYAGLFDLYAVISKTPAGFTEISGANFRFYPANSRSGLFWFLSAVSIGKKIARTENIDIIDAQDAGESGFTAYLVARALGVPFRLQVHTDVFSPWYRRAGWKEFLRFWLAKFLIPRASCVRVVSERIKRSLISGAGYPASKISVLPIFTDITGFADAKRDPAVDERFRGHDLKMIAAGRFVDREKNFSMLIAMMKDLLKVSPKAILVIAGDGPDRINYEAQVRNYGLEKHVILEKWRDDLPSFYGSFDLYLMPSNYEGWGRTVIEAMAAGLPVVMTDVGVAGEVVRDGENGLVVPVGDKKAFLEACSALYKDPSRRLRLGEAAKRTASVLGGISRSAYLASYKEILCACAVSAK